MLDATKVKQDMDRRERDEISSQYPSQRDQDDLKTAFTPQDQDKTEASQNVVWDDSIIVSRATSLWIVIYKWIENSQATDDEWVNSLAREITFELNQNN